MSRVEFSLLIVGIIVVAGLAAEAPTSPTSLEGVLQLGADDNARNLELERPNASKTRRRVGPPRAADFRLRPSVEVTGARNLRLEFSSSNLFQKFLLEREMVIA